MKRLTDNITSQYIAASNSLRPKNAKQKIVAYVESYDDITFWRTLFDGYECGNYHFQVMLPSRDSLSKGKKEAMMNMLGSALGSNMIACVDSDYDYLLQGATETSRVMIGSPYILHTYTYAIENFKCYAGCLHQVCVQSTLNDRDIIDFNAYMKLYSQIAYPLFVWDILFYRQHRLGAMPLLEFCKVVRLDSVDLSRPERSLELLQMRVNKKVEYLQYHYPTLVDKIGPLKGELDKLGVTPDTTYLYIQGHHIMDNVVLHLLVPVCNRLRHERENEIDKLAMHDKQYRNELSSYRNSQLPVEDILRRSTLYKDTPPYKKLQQEVENFLAYIDSHPHTDTPAAMPQRRDKHDAARQSYEQYLQYRERTGQEPSSRKPFAGLEDKMKQQENED